jgi:Ca2+-binding EF-hand superfamily protein
MHPIEEKKEDGSSLKKVPKRIAPCTKHPPEEYKKMMESMDTNGDGEITWDEFVAASINKIALLNKHNIRAAFNVLDENGDGKITREEL